MSQMNALTYINQHAPKPYLERWQRGAHIAATLKPYAGSERAIWSLITAIASMIDAHNHANEGSDGYKLGDDGYYHEHTKDLLQAARAYLNFPVGRFDCATLDQLILDLAGMAGLQEDDV